jgi:DNA-binding response OmpR family regulator
VNILLIDDDSQAVGPLRSNIEHHFQRQGARLFHCDNIKDGLELAKSDRSVKLVLLDVMMPCVAANALGSIPWIPKFPCSVAIYTAHTDETLIKAASDHGAVAYISKMDRAEEQLERIDELLKNITAAKVRIKTEETEGFRMRRHGWDRKLAAIVSIICILSAVGGAFTGAVAVGANRQKEKDAYIADKIETASQIALFKKETSLTIAGLEARLLIQEANAKTLHRMERNIDKLLLKSGIAPTRDDE